MKTLYLLLLLTASFPLVLPVSRKYFMIHQGRNWSDALAYCRATYTDLAIIENQDYMKRFVSDSQKQQLNSSAWIGLYNDINSWHWSFGNEPLGNMTKWMMGEPNNNGGRQECVAMHPHGWSDRFCKSTFFFVCFDDTRNGTERYINISNMMTWFAAQSYCRRYYTDLASTKDITEYLLVQSFFPNETWIGLFRDSWKWIDKSNLSTVSWMPYQPDNKLWHENCGYINNSRVGDALCSDIMPFVCYSGIIRKYKTVRLKVRSNQDVNDPGVKAAILEQIKQKLKDHGMAENSTVKWREQPDGLVFHKQKRE
ncbi:C-type mannose receptor 2-like [Hemibagrus wyckioides]|uniref:C-type mannose receptor 2-like n=1 Tax=Hemibagrus wyckioides TaxID=337641 RepID=UPI00266CDDC0|nr:C-type mannose receptor 2-like [Hemibagrus wyckioides]